MIEVFNLSTLEKRTYDLEPEAAVKAAYLQGKGNYNTWEYDGIEVEITRTPHYVTCGDWCVSFSNPLSVVDILYQEGSGLYTKTFVLSFVEFFYIRSREDIISLIKDKGFEVIKDFRATIGTTEYAWTLPTSQEEWKEEKFGDRFDYEFDIEEEEEK